jgi:hypothetical protein
MSAEDLVPKVDAPPRAHAAEAGAAPEDITARLAARTAHYA